MDATLENKMESVDPIATPLDDYQPTNNCSLCQKIFTDPKILPCFHNYCSSCLHGYTTQHVHSNKFTCPLCGMDCHLPSGGVNNLQTNLYIKAALTKSTVAADTPCEVCDNGTRADNSCLECEQNLCVMCSRGHLRMTSSREHHLVSLKDRWTNGEGQVMSKAFCEKHRGDELTFYCQKCSLPICLRCKITAHEQHATRDLSDVATETRASLQDMLKSAQTLLPTLHGHLSDVTAYNSHINSEGRKLRDKITHQTKKLHKYVDKISQELTDTVEDEIKVEAARLEIKRDQIGNQTTALSAQLHSANQVVSYGSDADITRNKETIAEQLRRIAKIRPEASIVRLYMEFRPGDAEHALNDVFGKLTRMREPDEKVTVKEFSSFSVNASVKAISSICPMSDGTAWIAIGWTTDVHHLYRNGTKIKTHGVGKTIDFITKDANGKLYMSCNEDRLVARLVADFNLDTFATFSGHHPRGLAFCPNGDLLVCLPQSPAYQDHRPSHRNKVACLNSVAREVTEYGADGKLFLYPLRVALNVNGDICVSDCKKSCVVILRQNGDVKCVYDGSDVAGLKKTIEPRGITCDSRGHVFVADSGNNTIHLLDHNGKFMRFLATEKEGLLGPYAVAIDTEDYLWVGGRDAGVKVFKLNWA